MTKHYETIVIGAGAARHIVAARLSEDPSINVLLLEVGGPSRLPARVPYTVRAASTTVRDGIVLISFGRHMCPVRGCKSVGVKQTW